MIQRIITALIGIPALIAVLWLRGWVSSLTIAVFCVMGLLEEYQAFRSAGHKPCVWPGMLAAAGLWPAYLWKGTSVLLPLFVFSMMVILFEIVRRKQPEWIDAAASLYPLITVFLPMTLFMTLLDDARQPIGLVLVIYAFIIAFGGDIFAYFAGTFWGKHKLCPAVSPKKTVEGAVAGLLGGAVLCMIAAFVCHCLGAPTPRYRSVFFLSIIGGAAGQIGDLAASLVKRHCGVKDFGSIFPGHGGIMDRLDSVLFTLVVVCSYCILFW